MTFEEFTQKESNTRNLMSKKMLSDTHKHSFQPDIRREMFILVQR
jgi:hypothetical protein